MLTVTDLLEKRSRLEGKAPLEGPGRLDSSGRSDRLAIIEGASGEGVTWSEVADQAERWAASGLEGPVGLALADPVAMATNFCAALAAGVVVAPLDPGSPGPDIEARVAALGLRSLVVGPDMTHPGDIEGWTAGRRELTRRGGSRRPGADLPDRPERVSALMASSGTTGAPKIVPLTEAQLLLTAEGVARELGLDAGERGYSPLPLFHINGLVVGVLSALVSGSTIIVDDHFSRRSFWSTVHGRGATWLNLVPAILSILGSVTRPSPHAGKVRLARSASAPLPPAVRERFEAATGIAVVETYGMTEAASQITANPLGDVRPGSVGRPVDVELRVLGDRVQIRGERVTPVYWRFEDRRWTSRAAGGPDGWLDTGDLGRVDAAGYVHLVGRDGDVINRGGEKVQPREVEDVLLGDCRVVAAVVVARPHSTVGEEPVAYVLPAPDTDIDADTLAADLLERCRSHLSRFKHPAEVLVARSLPAGPTGKVKRALVPSLATLSTRPTIR